MPYRPDGCGSSPSCRCRRPGVAEVAVEVEVEAAGVEVEAAEVEVEAAEVAVEAARK